MSNKFKRHIVSIVSITVAALSLLFAFTVWAATGTTDSSAVPDSTSSHTLEHIYDRLDTGAVTTTITFTEPSVAPGTGTMHTLDEIMAKAPAKDDTNGAATGDVANGKTFWGLTAGEWGMQTGTAAGAACTGDATAGDVLTGKTFSNAGGTGIAGTMPNNGAVTIVPTTTNQTIAAGYHNGAGKVEGDADLVAANIKSGVNIFGVDGTFAGTGGAGVPKTGQTASEATGDDGDLEKGVSWPDPRFTDNSDGTVTDNLTGLIWLEDANCINTKYPSFDTYDTAGDGKVPWQQALQFVAGINDGTYLNCRAGHTDWRLPNVREMQSLLHYGVYNPAVPNTAGTEKWTSGDPFTGVQSYYYWSSTTYADDTTRAWLVTLYDGSVYDGGKAGTLYVWPVRGGQ